MTGATGFVGAATLDFALSQGATVDALARSRQPKRKGVNWVRGALDDPESLNALVRNADVVLHIAGVVNAPDRAGFELGNALGTMMLVDAARRSHVRRFIHVSSLAAREPQLSDYGWSKELAERHVMASGLDWTIIRPPAIYGPRDREMLELFRMANRGFMLLPPGGRLSVIAVTDLARLLVALCDDRARTIAHLYEVDDGRAGGWTHAEFGHAIGGAIGRRVRALAVPAWLLHAAARGDRAIRGAKAKLTPDRARYFAHPDWVSSPTLTVPPDVWTPEIDTPTGLRQTVMAYRKSGWL